MDQFYFEEGYIADDYFVYISQSEANLIATATLAIDGAIAPTTGYYIPDYIAEGYYLGGEIKEAAAALTAESQQTVIVTKIQQLASALTVETSVTAVISHIEGADLFAFSEAQIQAAVDRIRDYNLAATDQFNIAIDYVRQRSSNADAAAEFTQTADFARSRDYESTIQAAFSFVAAAGIIYSAAAQLTTTAELTADIAKTADADSDLNTAASITIAAVTVKDGLADLNAVCEVTCTISHIHGADLSAFSDATVSAVIDKFTSYAAVISSESTQTTTAYKTVSALSDQSSAFSQITAEQRFRGINADLSSEFTQTAQGFNSAAVNIDISATSSVSAVISHIHGADLQAFSDAALLAAGDRLRGFESVQAITATISAQAERFRGISLNANIVTAIVAKPRFDFAPSLALTANFSVNTSAKLGSVRPFLFYVEGYESPYINQSTTEVKAGTYSIYMHAGYGQGGVAPVNSSNQPFLTKEFNIKANQDFIIEFWQKITNISLTDQTFLAISNLTTSGIGIGSTNSGNAILIGNRIINSQSNLSFRIKGGTLRTASWDPVPTGRPWRHIALRRIGSTIDLLLDNVVLVSETNSNAISNTNGSYFYLRNTNNFATDATRAVYYDDISFRKDASNVLGYTTFPMVNDPAKHVFLFNGEYTQATLNNPVTPPIWTRFIDNNGIIVEQSASLQVDSSFSKNNPGLLLITSADLSSAANISCDFDSLILEAAEAAFEVTSSIVSQPGLLQTADSVLSSSISITADSDILRNISAFINAEVTSSIAVERTRDVNIAALTESNLQCVISHIEGADLQAFSDAAVSADATKITDSVINAEAEATIVCVNDKILSAESQLVAAVTTAVDATKTTDITLDLPTAFAKTTIGDRIRFGQGVFSSDTALNADIEKITGYSAVLSAASEITIATEKILQLAAAFDSIGSQLTAAAKVGSAVIDSSIVATLNIETEVTFTANAVLASASSVFCQPANNYTGDAALIAETNQSCILSIEKQFASTLSVDTALTANAIKDSDIVLGLETAASVSAALDRFRFAGSNIASIVNITAVNERTRDNAAAISSDILISAAAAKTVAVDSAMAITSTVTASISHIEGAELIAFSDAALTVQAFVGVVGEANLQSSAAAAAEGSRTRSGESALAAASEITADALKIFALNVDLTAETAQTTTASIIANGAIIIDAAMTFTAGVREIDIDSVNQFIYKIPREIWQYDIPREITEYGIQEETRIFKIRR